MFTPPIAKRQFATSLLALFALALVSPTQASAQTEGPGSGHVTLELVVGYGGFIDESMIDHLAVGGAVRWLVTPRLGTGLEVLRLRGTGADRAWVLQPVLSWDLRREEPVTPYLVGGAGLLRLTESVGTGPYTSHSWTGGAGGGVRVVLTPRTTVSAEARLGTEPFTRVTGAIGWRW